MDALSSNNNTLSNMLVKYEKMLKKKDEDHQQALASLQIVLKKDVEILQKEIEETTVECQKAITHMNEEHAKNLEQAKQEYERRLI